jgi:hypothetical protein
VLIGIANPIPWAEGMMAVLMPMTSAARFTSGPLELPSLMDCRWQRRVRRFAADHCSPAQRPEAGAINPNVIGDDVAATVDDHA